MLDRALLNAEIANGPYKKDPEVVAAVLANNLMVIAALMNKPKRRKKRTFEDEENGKGRRKKASAQAVRGSGKRRSPATGNSPQPSFAVTES